MESTDVTNQRSAGEEADQVNQWWNKVLAGQDSQPHPLFGDAIRVRLRNGVLHILGEVASNAEREKVIGEARRYVGRGLDDVDARRLVVTRRDDERGLLDQTLIGAFANPDLAEYALKFIREHSRLKLKEARIVQSEEDPALNEIGEFAGDGRRALAAGNGVLIIRVDETDAFEARELLDEDTRSRWTVAMPPVPPKPGK